MTSHPLIAMKTNHRSWTAEDHRLYLETWLSGLPPVITALGRPLGCLVLLAAFMTDQPETLLRWLLRLW